jgi:hypothetical protein
MREQRRGKRIDLIEAIFCWFDSHTDFDTPQVRAAILSLHAQQSGLSTSMSARTRLMFRPACCIACSHCMCASGRAVTSDLLEHHHRRQHTPLFASPPTPLFHQALRWRQPRWPQLRPLLALLSAARPSSGTQPSAWWAVQPATAPAGPQEGSSAPRRNDGLVPALSASAQPQRQRPTRQRLEAVPLQPPAQRSVGCHPPLGDPP